MRERTLRRRCRRLLKDLDIQPPFDVAELCRRLGQQRGKPFRLVPYPIPVPGPFGMWIDGSSVDYIVYQQETTKAHQSHIVLHELGHILAGHTSADHEDAVLAALRRSVAEHISDEDGPDTGTDAVWRALRRTAYDSAQEREAETVATIIMEWASVLDLVAPQPSADPVTQRMAVSLGDRLGWL